MARFELGDIEWRLIKPLLPNKLPGGVARVDDRRVLKDLLPAPDRFAVAGDLPERYGSYLTIYNRFNRSVRTGVWVRVFETLSAKSPDSMALIDSSIIRAHQYAAGGKRGPGSRHRSFSWKTKHQDQPRR
jgi:transposase